MRCFRLIALFICMSPAAEASSGWVAPTVRLAAWAAIDRLDTRPRGADAQQRSTPLDRGLSIGLRWTFGGAAPIKRPRDGCAIDAEAMDGLDPDVIPETAQWATPWRDARDDIMHRCVEPADPIRPPADQGLVARRAAAVARARRTLTAAASLHARRRARIDLDEALALLRLALAARGGER